MTGSISEILSLVSKGFMEHKKEFLNDAIKKERELNAQEKSLTNDILNLSKETKSNLEELSAFAQMVNSKGRKFWAWFRPASKDDHLLDADQMNLVAAIMDSRIRPSLYTFADEIAEVKAD